MDALNKYGKLLEQSELDDSTVFIAAIPSNGTTGVATFVGDFSKMIKLLLCLVEANDDRKVSLLMKEVVIESFSKGLITIE